MSSSTLAKCARRPAPCDALTRQFYADLEKCGPLGALATNLFRAQKCSTRAKKYHGGVRGVGSY